MKRGSGFILIVILIILLGVFSYFLYNAILDYNPNSVSFFKKINLTELKNETSFSSGSQFYPNMRFPSNQISYNIYFDCSDEKKNKTISAFNYLGEETGLSFYSKEDDADISVSCSENEEKINESYFIAGEGGPVEIIISKLFNVINKGKVLLLYKKSVCGDYSVELHEILHVLGFKHSENKYSIMYPTLNCNQVLTNDIINEIKRLYIFEELPDLYFTNLSLIKHGKYIDFNVSVKNQGLAIAENIKLEISFGTVKIDSLSLGSINYGEGRVLEVSNLELPSRDVDNLSFKLIISKDLDFSNNQEVLVANE